MKYRTEPLEMPEPAAVRRARLFALWSGAAAAVLAVLAYALGVPF